MLKKLFQKLTSSGVVNPLTETPAVAISVVERKQALRKAKTALLERKMELTKELLDPLLRADKNDGDALAIEGMRLFELGHDELAAGVLQRAINCGSDDPLLLKCLASVFSRQGKRVPALAAAEEARKTSPNDAMLLNMLGSLYLSADRYDEAADAFNVALEHAPRDLALIIICNIAMLDGRGGATLHRKAASAKGVSVRKQLVRYLLTERKRRALSENEIVGLMILCGVSLENYQAACEEAEHLYARPMLDEYSAAQLGRFYATAGNLPRAIELCEQAIEGGEGVTRYFLGFLMAAAAGANWFSGWKMMDEGFLGMYAMSRVVTEVPIWDGRPLGKKRLFVYQDQGFGDILLGLRLLKQLSSKGIHAVFVFKPEMEAVLATVDVGVELVANEARPDPRDLNCAVAVPMFTLISLLNLRPEDLKKPVLIKAQPERCQSWRASLQAETKLRVGLVVTGNVWRADDWYRSLSAQAVAPLAAIDNVCWVNLAVDVRPERDAIIEKFDMLDPVPDIRDFADTAAVIDVLDVVVAIDCSVAHVAAALGKQVLVLVPSSIDWRWQIGGDTQPWWPTAKIFRSSAPACWDDAVSRLAQDLAAMARNKADKDA
ncbi:tetratricopeptide repeat-containing glycosyltransferase family protein [Uliginosibacterium flavum]|uniref:Tetratricopeptide repeat protein n=1 Tax=Uliginosibacterium flavum TaxID=1396831 RepID=A0ABV2TFU4_9RHOO